MEEVFYPTEANMRQSVGTSKGEEEETCRKFNTGTMLFYISSKNVNGIQNTDQQGRKVHKHRPIRKEQRDSRAKTAYLEFTDG